MTKRQPHFRLVRLGLKQVVIGIPEFFVVEPKKLAAFIHLEEIKSNYGRDGSRVQKGGENIVKQGSLIRRVAVIRHLRMVSMRRERALSDLVRFSP